MELLVVLGVFSLTVGMASSVFLLSNQAQRRTLALTSAQADLRFSLESIVREVRSGQIDYAAYAASDGVQVPAERLMLRTASGSRLTFFAAEDAATCPAGTARCLAVEVDGTAQAVTSAGVQLEALTFFVSPQADPYAVDEASGLYFADAQPLVTVALRLKTLTRRPEDSVALDAQTTVAARTYAR